MRTPSLLILTGMLALNLGCPSDDEAEGETGGTETASETAGTDTGECAAPPAGVYGNCIAGGEAACQAAGQDTLCPTDNLDNPSLGVIRTRPLCVYPKVARYKGAGSVDDAANFVCSEP